MKTRKLLWTLLPVVAVLLMTACGGDGADDVTPAPTPVTPTTDNVVKSQPYTVTVNTGDITRTSVDDDDVTLRFESTDQLYVQNADGSIYGCLELESGAGETSATFSGTIHYTGAEPAASTQLTATLVGSGNLLDMIGTDGKVKGDAYISIPATICETVSEAVQKYSWIRGTGTYGEAIFTLAQRTAFLRFSVTLEDGTAGGVSVPVVIKNDGSTIGSGTTVTTGSQFNALASFALPLEDDTEIAGDASMCVANVGSDDESITFGTGSTVALRGGKVYPVTRTKDFVRLWAGGPVWATKNLGASSITGYGGFYAWGGTTDVTSTDFIMNWNGNCPFYVSGTSYSNVKLSKYVPTAKSSFWGGSGSPDNKVQLEGEDDAATNVLNGSWRMPTVTEYANLLSNTNHAWKTENSINGRQFTGKGDYVNKAIFMPAAGERYNYSLDNRGSIGGYWTSSLNVNQPSDGSYFRLTSSNAETSSYSRYAGRSIRPVHD